jgi:uncharacterized repeat protein (TIGR01451 family)
MSVIAIPDRIRRSHRAGSASRVAATWGAGLVALVLLFACTSPAHAAPILDGNIDDVVALANTYISNGTGCGIVINDPAKDICLSDPLIVPCTTNITTCLSGSQYYVNGFDQILAVAAVQGTDAWWGIRVVGQIGDSDGDGTDGPGSNCPPPGLGQTPEDDPGIGPGERYIFRLDTNCDGVTDIRITVQSVPGGNLQTPQVFITDGSGLNPIPGASGQAMYTQPGHDLEIHTTGLQLPPVFSMNTFVGSDFDGMSEDAAGPAKCNAPTVALAIQKTASKPDICAGDSDRFTVSVTNNSQVAVVTNVRDVLPQGWTYANNISGDFAFNTQNGQVVSFGPLSLDPGATKTVSFDATSPSNCLGPYINKAVADGSFTTTCLGEPATALTDTATATVTCDSKPCVSQVHCSAPPTACNGDQITVKGFATNCGDRPADITITLNGHDHIVNGVAAGAVAEFDTTFGFSCTPGGPATQWSVSAVATNSCGTSAPGSSTCSTGCGNPACVSLQCQPGDTTVTVGDAYTVRVTATNCSTGTEDIVITVNGTQYSFPGVTASATVTAYVAGQCNAPGDATYNASATASNGCGTSAPATCQSLVHCQSGLCCWLTMGGFLNADMKSGSKDNTFGGNVGPPPSGSWEHIQRDGKTEVFNFHSHDAHVIACSNDGLAGPCHPAGDANVIDFGGTGAYSLNGGARTGNATFTAEAQDHGEPGNQPQHTGGCGTPDYYTITVKDATTGEVVFTAAGYLDGGNIQIHDCKHATQTSAPTRRGGGSTLSTNGTGDATSTDVSAAGAAAQVLELYRPTPNPFSNTTSFAYQVSGSESQRVQIGIYNVAGRLVRELVNETKAPGQYQTVWNGQDQGGVSVTHGVYFIRAYVGGVRVDTASRILYLR